MQSSYSFFPRVYTCFGTSEVHPAHMHCTHKWLDGLDEETMKKVIDAIERYGDFAKVMPEIVFNRIDFFGPKYDRVLLMRDFGNKKPLSLGLRMALDTIRKDDFENWNPHITCNDDEETDITISFNRYFLMVNNEIYREWVIG